MSPEQGNEDGQSTWCMRRRWERQVCSVQRRLKETLLLPEQRTQNWWCQTLCRGAWWSDREKLEHSKFWLGIRKSFFSEKVFKHRGTRAQRGCGISILEDVQVSNRHGPQQPDLIRPGFEQWVELDRLWRSPSRLNYSWSLWPMDVMVQCTRGRQWQKKTREVREKGKKKKL